MVETNAEQLSIEPRRGIPGTVELFPVEAVDQRLQIVQRGQGVPCTETRPVRGLRILDHVDAIRRKELPEHQQRRDHILAAVAAIVDDDLERSMELGDLGNDPRIGLVASINTEWHIRLRIDVQRDNLGMRKILLPRC